MLRCEFLDLLVLDCPPGCSPILEQAIAVADLVIVPTGPSKLDLAAVASTAAMAERAGVPFHFVPNHAASRTAQETEPNSVAARELAALWAAVREAR
jgi:chromosome partitioning protein